MLTVMFVWGIPGIGFGLKGRWVSMERLLFFEEKRKPTGNENRNDEVRVLRDFWRIRVIDGPSPPSLPSSPPPSLSPCLPPSFPPSTDTRVLGYRVVIALFGPPTAHVNMKQKSETRMTDSVFYFSFFFFFFFFFSFFFFSFFSTAQSKADKYPTFHFASFNCCWSFVL